MTPKRSDARTEELGEERGRPSPIEDRSSSDESEDPDRVMSSSYTRERPPHLVRRHAESSQPSARTFTNLAKYDPGDPQWLQQTSSVERTLGDFTTLSISNNEIKDYRLDLSRYPVSQTQSDDSPGPHPSIPLTGYTSQSSSPYPPIHSQTSFQADALGMGTGLSSPGLRPAINPSPIGQRPSPMKLMSFDSERYEPHSGRGSPYRFPDRSTPPAASPGSPGSGGFFPMSGSPLGRTESADMQGSQSRASIYRRQSGEQFPASPTGSARSKVTWEDQQAGQMSRQHSQSTNPDTSVARRTSGRRASSLSQDNDQSSKGKMSTAIRAVAGAALVGAALTLLSDKKDDDDEHHRSSKRRDKGRRHRHK